MVSTVLIDKDAAIAAIKRLEIDGPQMIWSSDAIDAVQGVEPDAPHVPDVDRVIDNMRVIRKWASTGASVTVAKVLDEALALIEAQQKTLDEIDKYVRELDKAVNKPGIKSAEEALLAMGEKYILFFRKHPDYFHFLFQRANIKIHHILVWMI